MKPIEFGDPNIPEEDRIEFNFGKVSVAVPAITEENVEYVVSSVTRNAGNYFSEPDSFEKARKALENANRAKLAKDSMDEGDVANMLADVTGYSANMIRDFGLPVFEWFSDLGDFYGMLEEIERRARDKSYHEFFPIKDHLYLKAVGKGKIKKYKPSDTVAHILSGNVVGYTALPLLMGTAGMPQIIKVSGDEPLSLLLYADIIAKEDSNFRKTFAVGYWKGGDERIEEKLFSGNVFVDVMGSNEVIESVEERIGRKARMAGHGYKVGFAVVDKNMVNEDVAERLARDISIWDGFACFNVKNIFVYGDENHAKMLAGMLDKALKSFSETYPASFTDAYRTTLMEKFFIYGLRGYETIVDKDGQYFINIGDDFEPPGMLCRSTNIIPFTDIERVARKLKEYSSILQTAVVAAESEGRAIDIAYFLSDAGATNIHMPGCAHYFEPGEPHDGGYDLLKAKGVEDNLRWTAVNFKTNY
ncbi:MAG: hypothetical protein DRP03_02620 [Candidatus Aenigmatarchaeota archaeon]|nr:MAG: hypothetical protein DRP03_02620 [Candidatus Aenigmarchaeota archaeon]